MNNRRLAKSSGSPRLPFICMTVYRTFWRRSDRTRSCSARSRWRCTGCDVRTPITTLVRHVLSELEIRFSSVSINWRWATCASTSMRNPPCESRCADCIFLRRPLYCLIIAAWSGIMTSVLTVMGKSRPTRSRSIPGKVASGRSFKVQKTTDSDVRLFLVLNVCIDDLLPCAAMLERGFGPAKGDSVEHQRIQRSLHLEEDLCVCHPPRSHSCRSQRLLDTGEDGPELRQNIIVFPRCSLDASIRRQAEAIEVEALRYRLAEGGARKLVMNCRIPVEVGMQKRPQIVAFLLLLPPSVHPYAIECQERRILIPELLLVSLPQIAEPFGDLEPYLHSHGPLGQ